MSPGAGERRVQFVGDHLVFTLTHPHAREWAAAGWTARLRTNLGRAGMIRQEIIQSKFHKVPLAGASWRDIPMRWVDGEWQLTLPLTEVGWFKAKPYALDPQGFQHWPSGDDFGVCVHPGFYRSANTIYCAFARMFGETRTLVATTDPAREAQMNELDRLGYTVIPPSGKLRDVVRQLPHIMGELGCRILHLLPVSPTPTTYARFGRFGSPYAAEDMTAIDPALVEFDQRTTGVEQFEELTAAVHARGGRVFLDIVINHTGWGSWLQENHPEWFVRHVGDGRFESPGAWGTVWEDLVELAQRDPALWEYLAESFLTWCRRGVDGFRCDAGYKVPAPAWQHIIARVREEFPDALFLLEGLGGGWQDTETLLTEGGMQWAYSELFQEFGAQQVAGYLDHAYRQSHRVGTLVHYSETHDNDRLAKRGRTWALLRNQLSALSSVNGGFGFTCGVEWLCAEKINVHSCRALAWGSEQNIVPELSRLNALLAEHPAFFDGARLHRISPSDSFVYALRRVSEDGLDAVLVLVNLDPDREHRLTLEQPAGELQHDLLAATAGMLPRHEFHDGKVTFTLAPGAAHCLSATVKPIGLNGEAYRSARAQAAFGLAALAQARPIEELGAINWRALAQQVATDPAGVLAAALRGDSVNAAAYSPVVEWSLADSRRVVLVPPGHWLLVRDTAPFRVSLRSRGAGKSAPAQRADSIPVTGGHVACFAPGAGSGDAELALDQPGASAVDGAGILRFLPATPAGAAPDQLASAAAIALLTNGAGAMARLAVDLGTVRSKYDCVLGANLHASLPVDRHVFAKRLRAWVNADGFITPLNADNLVAFSPGPPAVWHFVANAGDGRSAEIHLAVDMVPGRNTTLLSFSRPRRAPALGRDLPAEFAVGLTVRLDIEDRNFHHETTRNPGTEHHFATNSHALQGRAGFVFTPAHDRLLRVWSDSGRYHHEGEWSVNLPHPVEATRGMTGQGDGYSPGWFELPLTKGQTATLAASAEFEEQFDLAAIQFAHSRVAQGTEGQRPPSPDPVRATHAAMAATKPEGKAGEPAAKGAAARTRALFDFIHESTQEQMQLVLPGGSGARTDNTPAEPGHAEGGALSEPVPPLQPVAFAEQLERAIRAFVVRRGEGKTVIAGYPWFLDWGRDTLICARGLIAAGWQEEVRQILITFGRFAEHGTLPNTIHGDNVSNRDTSDAPLWFGVVCEDFHSQLPPGTGPTAEFYATPVDTSGRTLTEVLRSIAAGYLHGTPNGIRMDAASGLVWSPSHFTWMDTNYPAGTPREGYPVEIQALWIRLLRQLDRLRVAPEGEPWSELAARAEHSLNALFWLENQGWFADCLLARPGVPAREATPDTALRSNMLFPVSLGLVSDARARRCVDAALRHLVIPGALRSLAPLPVQPPLPIHAADGRLLNDPVNPYWGRYEGDEDTRRKPAYHNGTAWTWTFPVFCEALARAYNFTPDAVAAARAYLGSASDLLQSGCIGQLPEIVDGDAPHAQRGCDAQAWSATEALRVWRLLDSNANHPPAL